MNIPTFPVFPRVIDVSHYDVIESLDGVIRMGIWGIIHKATEGNAGRDSKYDARRKWAKEKGLLWGAYHFVRPGTVVSQVEWFLNNAKPDDSTLLALDWEVSNVPVDFVEKFLREIERRTERKMLLYSGNTAREAFDRVKKTLSTSSKEYFQSHRLWHAQYSKSWQTPWIWDKPWLWQYSGDGMGQPPHGVEGITVSGKQICDMNSFEGTREELENQWSGLKTIPVVKETV